LAKTTQLEADEGVTVMVAGSASARTNNKGEKSARRTKVQCVSGSRSGLERASIFLYNVSWSRKIGNKRISVVSRESTQTRDRRQAGPPGAPPPPDHRVPCTASATPVSPVSPSLSPQPLRRATPPKSSLGPTSDISHGSAPGCHGGVHEPRHMMT